MFVWCRFELRVRENSPADTVVGRVTVADRENRRLHDHVSFSLRTSLARRLFRIDSDTGRLYTRGPLDRELRTAYLFIVGVQSASMRSSATAQVKVTVDDVNDCSPTWVFPMSPNNDTVHVNFGFGLDEVPVATLVAKDADDGDNARLRSVSFNRNSSSHHVITIERLHSRWHRPLLHKKLDQQPQILQCIVTLIHKLGHASSNVQPWPKKRTFFFLWMWTLTHDLDLDRVNMNHRVKYIHVI